MYNLVVYFIYWYTPRFGTKMTSSLSNYKSYNFITFNPKVLSEHDPNSLRIYDSRLDKVNFDVHGNSGCLYGAFFDRLIRIFLFLFCPI